MKKKKTSHEMDMIHVDEHVRVKEAIVPGPDGRPGMVVLEIDDDLHFDEVVKKDEVVENVHDHSHHHLHGLHGKSAPATVAEGGGSSSEAVVASSSASGDGRL
ncbi:hypothetical protein LINGRAHAP2_LOCUS32624 [Linum grandiflorum]